jgi:hypothetical protein
MTNVTSLAATAGSGDIGVFLSDMSSWGSEFDGTFANHAPMALTALAGIGGTRAELERFFAYYKSYKKLKPFQLPVAPLDATTWQSVKGDRTREADLRAFFRREVVRLGVDAALLAYLPELAPGVAASAFHALMRLAYALLCDNADDVAIALGYWAATFLAMPPATGAPPTTEDPAQVLVRTMTIAPLHDLPLHELLWQNMRDAAAVPDFKPVVDWLAIDDRTLARMATTGLAIFAATQHFAALHIVTGLHWLRIIEPKCTRPTFYLLLRHFWQGIAGLVGELGFPELPSADMLDQWRRTATPDWFDLKRVAAKSLDEHDISLAFSAHEEMKVYGNPLYQVVAARRLGLIKEYRR